MIVQIGGKRLSDTNWTSNLRLSEYFEDGKYPRKVLAVGVIVLLLLELGIFIGVYNQSGLRSRVTIVDSNGKKLYESPGSALTAYEKMVFENNYGPIRNYNTQVDSELTPFNYRAWILISIGIPIGLILMIFFMSQVWLILLNGGEKERPPTDAGSDKTRLNAFLSVSRNFSVLHVGFIIVVSMLILWLIPSFLSDAAKSCFNAVREYPWFFIGASLFFGGLLVWVIYLRYKLSKQMLVNQFEIEKYRIKKQLLIQNPAAPHLLIASRDEDEPRAQFSRTGES